MKVGMVCIDIFSKYMVVVPLMSKQPADILAGLVECVKKMDGKPKLIYIDDEGAYNNQSAIDFLKGEKIELRRTRGHPAFAERAIRTFKDSLYKRVENDEKKGKAIQWTDYIHEIVLTYNNGIKHTSHGLTPSEARKPKHQLEVSLNLGMKAKRNRVYPDLIVGNEVKIFRKRRPNEKERVGVWTKQTYKIAKIERKLRQESYYIESYDSALLRHELLKVEIKTIYIIIEIVETETNSCINKKKCYDCCHFKKENMELYKLNLPSGIVNNIIDYSLDKNM